MVGARTVIFAFGAVLYEMLTGKKAFEAPLAEEERGYVPFNFPWELRQLPPGEHVLTVNVVTFDGQIGMGRRRIRIAR